MVASDTEMRFRAGMHVIGVDDAPVLDDVEIDRFEAVRRLALDGADQPLRPPTRKSIS